jgi:hypothetical protein
MSTTDIKEALLRLDAENDEHWTSTGLPKVEAVVASLKYLNPLFEGTVKRGEIEDALPNFDRASLFNAENADTEPQPSAEAEAEAEAEAPAEGEPEAEPDGDPVAETEDEVRARYLAHLAKLADGRSVLEAEREFLVRRIAALDKEAADVTAAMYSEVGPISFAVAHKRHVQAQIDNRMRRAGRVSEINEFAGFRTGLSHQTPLDQALKNRRRGPASSVG